MIMSLHLIHKQYIFYKGRKDRNYSYVISIAGSSYNEKNMILCFSTCYMVEWLDHTVHVIVLFKPVIPSVWAASTVGGLWEVIKIK